MECPVCQEAITQEGDTCPHCGERLSGSVPQRKGLPGWAIALIVTGGCFFMIFLIGIIAAIVIPPQIQGQMANARLKVVQADMKMLERALSLFKIDNGYYPQQLSALWEDPGSSRWKGPYLDRYPPKDPWNGEYQYVYKSGGQVEIISLGADNAPGGINAAEDLSSLTLNSGKN